jgi:hypothetical protein
MSSCHAAGEYISVYSQKDSQEADMAKEEAAQRHVRPVLLLQSSDLQSTADRASPKRLRCCSRCTIVGFARSSFCMAVVPGSWH